MQASFFVDFTLSQQPDLDLTPHALRNQIYAVLHGAFRQQPQTFALALPKQKAHVLRVFAANQSALTGLITAVSGHWKLRDYCRISAVQAVGEHQGGWLSYKRFRIPAAKSDRNHAQDSDQNLHTRRLDAAKTTKKPFLQVASNSTGQRFTIFIDCVAAEGAGTGLPDGYGLSRSSQSFALPDLPYQDE